MSEPADVQIVTYRPDFQPAFEALNRAWLEPHGLLEPADLEFLQNPGRHILADGGQLFMAVIDEVVVGSCAAIRISARHWELAKLTVADLARGAGIGRRLAERVIAYARNAGATSIDLTSNHQLVAAIRLYESLGFTHAPIPADVRYVTADVYMVKSLGDGTDRDATATADI